MQEIKDQYTFHEIKGTCVVIKGIEYEYNYMPRHDYAYIIDNRFNKYDITNKEDQEEFYYYLKTDDFIDGLDPYINVDGWNHINTKEISHQDYQTLIKNILDKCHIDKKDITIWLKPIHIIRPYEVEALYYYETIAVLNGHEVKRWFDGKDLSRVRYFESWINEYYDSSFAIGNNRIVVCYDPEIKDIPTNRVRYGHPQEGFHANLTIISKKYFDKVIVDRHLIKRSKIGKMIHLEKGDFSGEVESVELDLNNPNPNTLKIMEGLGVCSK